MMKTYESPSVERVEFEVIDENLCGNLPTTSTSTQPPIGDLEP